MCCLCAFYVCLIFLSTVCLFAHIVVPHPPIQPTPPPSILPARVFALHASANNPQPKTQHHSRRRSQHPASALRHFDALLQRAPLDGAVGRARALDRLADRRKDNALLERAIEAYADVLERLHAAVGDDRLLALGTRCVELMRFKGEFGSRPV